MLQLKEKDGSTRSIELATVALLLLVQITKAYSDSRDQNQSNNQHINKAKSNFLNVSNLVYHREIKSLTVHFKTLQQNNFIPLLQMNLQVCNE